MKDSQLPLEVKAGDAILARDMTRVLQYVGRGETFAGSFVSGQYVLTRPRGSGISFENVITDVAALFGNLRAATILVDDSLDNEDFIRIIPYFEGPTSEPKVVLLNHLKSEDESKVGEIKTVVDEDGKAKKYIAANCIDIDLYASLDDKPGPLLVVGYVAVENPEGLDNSFEVFKINGVVGPLFALYTADYQAGQIANAPSESEIYYGKPFNSNNIANVLAWDDAEIRKAIIFEARNRGLLLNLECP